MTPEESSIDVEARTKALADKGIIGNGSQAPAGRKRATRKDAGTKRGPKVQPLGVLNAEQAAHLKDLLEARERTSRERDEAMTAANAACGASAAAHAELSNYIDRITAK